MAWRSSAFRVLFSLWLILFLSVTAADAGKKKPPAKPININTATSEELQQVPGIGPATASKILQMRKSYGAFKTIDDLLAIRGLGQKTSRQNAQVLDRWKNDHAKSDPARHETCCFSSETARQP
jgi:competence ComEA-like helix-hairpin-helix protein